MIENGNPKIRGCRRDGNRLRRRKMHAVVATKSELVGEPAGTAHHRFVHVDAFDVFPIALKAIHEPLHTRRA